MMFIFPSLPVERRRRDKINNWIVQLSKIIPDCSMENTKSGQVRGLELAFCRSRDSLGPVTERPQLVSISSSLYACAWIKKHIGAKQEPLGEAAAISCFGCLVKADLFAQTFPDPRILDPVLCVSIPLMPFKIPFYKLCCCCFVCFGLYFFC